MLSVNGKFNFSIAYKGFRSLGKYQLDQVESGNFRFTSNYVSKNDKYSYRGHIAAQDIINDENVIHAIQADQDDPITNEYIQVIKDMNGVVDMQETLIVNDLNINPVITFNFKGDRQNHTPKHWLEEINYKDKKYTSDIIEEVDITSSQEAKLFKKTKELENSGWFNPYLCI